MDLKKIGIFLAALRKEKGLTQEQLGEKLGVTNKTVSRWENGNYLPTVEMLQSLSDLYGITINEILSAEKLDDANYRQKAEENIKTALSSSSFTLNEKIAYYKRKWLREHFWGNVISMLPALGFLFAYFRQNDMGFWLISVFLGLGTIMVRRNAMMTYVEQHAYDGSGRQ